MRSFTFWHLAVFTAAALALDEGNIHTFVDPTTNQTIRRFDCGVSRAKASHHFNETIRFLHRNSRRPNYVGSRAANLVKKQVSSPISVTTYMHLLTTTAKAGMLTTEMADAQLVALNAAYKPIGISFVMGNVTVDANDAWAVAANADMDALKQARRYGSYADLNLYFHTDLDGGILGTCTLPSQVTAATNPSQYYSDGCNINAATMPGGDMTGYNKGMTAVHETGHWLGLLHTFEGYSCTGEGDSIADTPMQSVSTDGCPAKPAKDSCPGLAGVDPIHNYMDYSSDDCYESFTPGQIARISSLWAQYRQGH